MTKHLHLCVCALHQTSQTTHWLNGLKLKKLFTKKRTVTQTDTGHTRAFEEEGVQSMSKQSKNSILLKCHNPVNSQLIRPDVAAKCVI